MLPGAEDLATFPFSAVVGQKERELRRFSFCWSLSLSLSLSLSTMCNL